MYTLISFAMAVFPALFILNYYYKQDKNKPEPKGLIFKIFFLGILLTIPAIILELIVGLFKPAFGFMPLLVYFFEAFIVAALCEEGLKFWLVKKQAYNNVHFDEVMDGIVYTVVASLGFACMENILYVMGGGMSIALVRAFTAVPMHALASGIMGYYIGKAKFTEDKAKSKELLTQGLFIAILIHGFYDFLLFSTPVFGILAALGIVPLLLWVFYDLKKKIKSALREDIEAGRVIEKK